MAAQHRCPACNTPKRTGLKCSDPECSSNQAPVQQPKTFDQALDELAVQVPGGERLAVDDPAAFIEAVTQRLNWLSKEHRETYKELRELHDKHERVLQTLRLCNEVRAFEKLARDIKALELTLLQRLEGRDEKVVRQLIWRAHDILKSTRRKKPFPAVTITAA